MVAGPSGGRVSQWKMEAGSLVKAETRILSPLVGESTISIKKFSCIVSTNSCSIFLVSEVVITMGKVDTSDLMMIIT